MALVDSLASDVGDQVDQLVDRDQPISAQVERLRVVAAHQSMQPLDAVVDVAVRAGLPPVAPDLDLVSVAGQCDLAADRRRRLLATAVVRAQLAIDVVEADDSRLETEVLPVV